MAAALGLVLGYFAILYLILGGVGLLVQRVVFRLPADRLSRVAEAFWIGFAILIGLLSGWHFAFRITLAPLAIMAAAAVIGWAGAWRSVFGLIRRSLRGWRAWVLAALFGVLILWLAHRATQNVTWYDAGLYYLPAMRWFNTYAIVPGLANVHGRFGFNNANLLYGALLNALPGADGLHRLSTPLLYAALVAHLLIYIKQVIHHPRSAGIVAWFGASLLGPMMVSMVMDYVSSSRPDSATYILTLVIALLLLDLLRRPTDPDHPYLAYVIVLVSAAAITVKVSMIAFGASASLIALLILWRGSLSWRRLVAISAPAAVMVIAWMLRGAVISGYLAYPVTQTALPVEWRVPLDVAAAEAASIASWAREPYGEPAVVLSSWAWVRGWLAREWWRYDFSFPVGLSVIALALAQIHRLLRPQRQAQGERQWWLVVVPPIISLIYWFATAPGVHFITGSIWVLAVAVTLLCFYSFPATGRIAAMVLAGFVAVYSILLTGALGVLLFNGVTNGEGFHPIQTTAVRAIMTESGLVIYVPVSDERCFEAEMPCASIEPDPRLSLRRDGDLSAGFLISPPD